MTKLINPAPKGWLDTSAGWIPGQHRGQDFGWHDENDRPVVIAADGVVVQESFGGGYNGGWGNFYLVDHGNDFYTGYAHFETGTQQLNLGQKVTAGTYAGEMGDTGKATGPHLHFEVRIGGSGPNFRVDPAPYLDGTLSIPGTDNPTPSNTAAQRTVRNFALADDVLFGRLGPTTSAEVAQRLAQGDVGNFDGWVYGDEVTIDGVTSNVWFRGAYRGNFFSAAGFTSQATDGLPHLDSGTPAQKWFDVPDEGQYYYHQYNNALNGDFDENQLIPASAGSLAVIDNPGEGPVKVAYLDGVWVGTRNHPAAIR